MPPGQSKVAHKIDSLMEQASEALVQRRYFECEKIAADALRRALGVMDFDRVARITLPLQEARRQIRDLAVDSGNLVNVTGEVPTGAALKPGMYLVSPPRVGVDGRILREEATRREIPVVIIVREPTTQAGLWPIVAVGPVTVRTRIAPPAGTARAASTSTATTMTESARPAKTSGKIKVPKGKATTAPNPNNGQSAHAVNAEWMLLACEALGDEAIASLGTGLTPVARVLALAERLEAVPDHEKLHQRLEEAAREAARIPVKKVHARAAAPISEDE